MCITDEEWYICWFGLTYVDLFRWQVSYESHCRGRTKGKILYPFPWSLIFVKQTSEDPAVVNDCRCFSVTVRLSS